jgi:hypothetical protein
MKKKELKPQKKLKPIQQAAGGKGVGKQAVE